MRAAVSTSAAVLSKVFPFWHAAPRVISCSIIHVRSTMFGLNRSLVCLGLLLGNDPDPVKTVVDEEKGMLAC